jgi:hypothetical protein
MKTHLLIWIALWLLITIIPSFSQTAAPAWKKAAIDTNLSTINPRVATLGIESFAVGIRVPKGGGMPGSLSVTRYSNAALRTADTVYSAHMVQMADFAVTTTAQRVWVAYGNSQSAGDVAVLKMDASLHIAASFIMNSVSGTGMDYPVSMRPSGAHVFVAGTCYSADKIPATGFNAFVIKMDTLGNTQWTRFFEGFGATSVAPTGSGHSFVLVKGFDASWNVIQKVFYLDSSGNTIWTTVLSTTHTATTTCFDSKTSNLVIAMNDGLGTSFISFLTIDQAGNQSPVFVSAESGSIVQMEDSFAGIVVCGSYGLYGSSNLGAYAAEYDINFNRLWFRKEANGLLNQTPFGNVFTGLAMRNAGTGFVFAGSRSRSFWPGSTYDQIYSRMTYPVPNVSITPSGTITICAGQSVTLSVSLDSTATYVWKKGTNTIAGATGNTLIVSTGGNYKVTVTNKYGISRTSVRVTVTVGCREMNEDQEQVSESHLRMQDNESMAFPNPFHDVLNLSVPGMDTFSGRIALYDMGGRLVMETDMEKTGNNGFQFPVAGINNGTYLLRIASGNEVYQQLVIKQ